MFFYIVFSRQWWRLCATLANGNWFWNLEYGRFRNEMAIHSGNTRALKSYNKIEQFWPNKKKILHVLIKDPTPKWELLGRYRWCRRVCSVINWLENIPLKLSAFRTWLHVFYVHPANPAPVEYTKQNPDHVRCVRNEKKSKPCRAATH